VRMCEWLCVCVRARPHVSVGMLVDVDVGMPLLLLLLLLAIPASARPPYAHDTQKRKIEIPAMRSFSGSSMSLGLASNRY